MKQTTAHSSLVQQPIRWMGCFFMLVLFCVPAKAQLTISSQAVSFQDIRRHPALIVSNTPVTFSEEASQSQHPRFNADGIWLPEYARENPAGHAPLCRIETGLENRMRIPLWIKAGEIQNLSQLGTGNLYLRMKLLRF